MSVHIKFLILSVFCSRTSYCREFRFDYKYHEEVDGFFKYNLIPASWHEASLRCLYEGAKLVSPTSPLMLKAMKDIWGSGLGTHAALWTGVSATLSKGDYFSIEGVPLTRMPISWAPNEPDNYENCEDCLAMLPNGSLADVSCNDSFPYICFREKSSVVSECGTLDSEYKLDKRTGSCYKFHRAALIWSRAMMICAAEGGYLAVIDTAGEQTVLKEIFAKNPANTIMYTWCKDSAHVGIVNWGETGVWTTIHGDALEDMLAASKGAWSTGQPDNATRNGEGQSCGSIFRSGLYDDIWCHVPTPFICEKNPESLLN